VVLVPVPDVVPSLSGEFTTAVTETWSGADVFGGLFVMAPLAWAWAVRMPVPPAAASTSPAMRILPFFI